jgi:hypothetical protein
MAAIDSVVRGVTGARGASNVFFFLRNEVQVMSHKDSVQPCR